MNPRQVIGWNLKRIRVNQGVTQERLALEAEVDRAYVGRIERGMENVTVATLEALATVLQVPVADLFAKPRRATPVAGLKAGRKPK
ncbi:MAG TPA: helix-turn-helix transcriptional regulator [Aestuariivirga sp.]|nr:helix-turn-helix transcriptional regulator [Aestuariivirga sp.]